MPAQRGLRRSAWLSLLVLLAWLAFESGERTSIILWLLSGLVIAGLFWRDVDTRFRGLARIRAETAGGYRMAVRPNPNLMFTRDRCVSLYDRVLAGRTAARGSF